MKIRSKIFLIISLFTLLQCRNSKVQNNTLNYIVPNNFIGNIFEIYAKNSINCFRDKKKITIEFSNDGFAHSECKTYGEYKFNILMKKNNGAFKEIIRYNKIEYNKDSIYYFIPETGAFFDKNGNENQYVMITICRIHQVDSLLKIRRNFYRSKGETQKLEEVDTLVVPVMFR